MKKGNLKRWTNINDCLNLLFFSQLVNELLFDYSIPSNRISTLNCHYLVIDALSAIDGIDNYGVPEGNLKPIMSELYYELNKESIFVDKHPLDYFLKQSNGKVLSRVYPKDMNYLELKNCAISLKNVFFSNNDYYSKLKERIIKIVKDNKIDEQEELFRLTKIILTELKNKGYSLKYIYFVMNQLFWNPMKCIDSNDIIDEFFNAFDFKKKKYTVVFKVNLIKMKPLVTHLDGLEFKDFLSEDEIKFMDTDFKCLKSDEKYVTVSCEALDPYSSADNAEKIIEQCAYIFRMYDHTYKYSIRSADYRVLTADFCYKKGKTVNAVEHIRMLKDSRILENTSFATDSILKMAEQGHYKDFKKLINAAKFHSHSIDSIAEENQLLDLWAIFEAVLNISSKHTSDRIIQVCNYLVPILKYKYIYSLFSQLYDDIKAFDKEWCEINLIGKNADEKIKNLAEFVLLDTNSDKREDFYNLCFDFPLLKERIKYYNSALNNPSQVFDYVEKHANRVRWQIMRIYRNRNLIIHNADNMPYLNLLVENLHSYVDDFLYYVIESVSDNNTIFDMCQELFVKDFKWNSTFTKRKEKNLTKEDIQIILAM